MRRTSIDQRVKRELSRATEFERNRRISLVEDALEHPGSEICKSMQATNGRLIEVHQSLKEIFKRREVSYCRKFIILYMRDASPE